jgi:hypothetical protein
MLRNCNPKYWNVTINESEECLRRGTKYTLNCGGDIKYNARHTMKALKGLGNTILTNVIQVAVSYF